MMIDICRGNTHGQGELQEGLSLRTKTSLCPEHSPHPQPNQALHTHPAILPIQNLIVNSLQCRGSTGVLHKKLGPCVFIVKLQDQGTRALDLEPRAPSRAGTSTLPGVQSATLAISYLNGSERDTALALNHAQEP